MRSAVRVFAGPPKPIGIRLCTGRGSHHRSVNVTLSLANETGGACSHNARHARTESTIREVRPTNARPASTNSSRCHPLPTPRSTRPLESTSRVATDLAVSNAGRTVEIKTPVASLTRLVTAAMAARVVIGSSQGS
ncbi:unannotated protein [freshwater metagenome]|uniref:Unannotated protein n=1 Tax=freshwater metagenome TaxID=449393 RepID=A0A6J7NQ55_9ZZZZ